MGLARQTDWSGWERYSSPYANHPLFFTVWQQLQDNFADIWKTPDFNRDFVIFKTNSIIDHLDRTVEVGSEEYRELLEGWRVLPFPDLQLDSEHHTVSLLYAIVNPYSRQQEAAIEYLDVVLANQAKVVE